MITKIGRNLILIVGVLTSSLVIWLKNSKTETVSIAPISNSSSTIAKTQIPAPATVDSFTARLASLLLTPITFYGKVVDQHSQPIADATVNTIAQNSALGHGTDRMLSTDSHGLFSLSGAHGSNLVVRASKEGFHQITDLQSRQYHLPPSQKDFAYALDRGDGIFKPDKANPVVFMLYRPGALEPLLTRPEVSWYLEEGGGTSEVPLHPDESSLHCVMVDLWIEKGVSWWPRQPFDWKLKVSAVEGSVRKHNDLFPFEAPEENYEASASEEFAKTMPQKSWKDYSTTSYYIRFNDNTFARISVECRAGENSLIVLKSWLNPKAGSRNLEPTGSNK